MQPSQEQRKSSKVYLSIYARLKSEKFSKIKKSLLRYFIEHHSLPLLSKLHEDRTYYSPILGLLLSLSFFGQNIFSPLPSPPPPPPPVKKNCPTPMIEPVTSIFLSLNLSLRELKQRRSGATSGNRKLDILLLTPLDAIASVKESHQRPRHEFSSPRQVTETTQQREQLTSGCRWWLTNVCA